MTYIWYVIYCNKEETNVVDSQKNNEEVTLKKKKSVTSVNYVSLRMKRLKLFNDTKEVAIYKNSI